MGTECAVRVSGDEYTADLAVSGQERPDGALALVRRLRPEWRVDTWRIHHVDVARLELVPAVRLLQDRIEQRRFTRVAFCNAHLANVAHDQPSVAADLEDFLVLPDGVGVDIAARAIYGEPFPANLNGTDFVPELLTRTTRPLTIALIGAPPEAVLGAQAALAEMAPQHRIVAVSDGYFSPDEEPVVLERLAELRPDVLLVAMGVPLQEEWIRRSITEAHATVVLAVGALFDFLSGSVPRAPRAMRRLRLEWLYRLSLEPMRMWRRYVVGNPRFLARTLRQKVTGHC